MKVTLQGVSYEYEVAGSGEPLLLLHGFTGSMETWRSFIPSWSEQFQVILVDIVGHGKTESPEEVTHYDIQNVALQMKNYWIIFILKMRIYLAIQWVVDLRLRWHAYIQNMCIRLLLENCTAGLENAEGAKERKEKDERLADKIEQEGIRSFCIDVGKYSAI